MTSATYSPSIDQGAKLQFQDTFYNLAQQTKSKLVSNKAIKMLSPTGKTNNMARIGRLELAEVEGRNPDKQYVDYALDNRRFSKRRFTATVMIDEKTDINELLKDPTSDLMNQLLYAKERVIDRIAVASAVGSVLVGAPDAAASTISAATDGVITVDASAGLTYDKIQEITQNYINNDFQYMDFAGSTLCITGKENTALMGETKFINNDYISARPVEAGVQTKAGTYNVEMFAGSVSGGVTALNPILPEGTTYRSCVVLAPESIAMSMQIGRMEVERNPNKVNTWDLTVDLWINAMRTEGVKVQIVKTTI